MRFVNWTPSKSLRGTQSGREHQQQSIKSLHAQLACTPLVRRKTHVVVSPHLRLFAVVNQQRIALDFFQRHIWRCFTESRQQRGTQGYGEAQAVEKAKHVQWLFAIHLGPPGGAPRQIKDGRTHFFNFSQNSAVASKSHIDRSRCPMSHLQMEAFDIDVALHFLFPIHGRITAFQRRTRSNAVAQGRIPGAFAALLILDVESIARQLNDGDVAADNNPTGQNEALPMHRMQDNDALSWHLARPYRTPTPVDIPVFSIPRDFRASISPQTCWMLLWFQTLRMKTNTAKAKTFGRVPIVQATGLISNVQTGRGHT